MLTNERKLWNDWSISSSVSPVSAGSAFCCDYNQMKSPIGIANFKDGFVRIAAIN
jgi:hypothetical protein